MDYKRLYHIMLNASEKAIEAIENGEAERAAEILVAAEQEAEEYYIENISE
ncbi:MAG: hypothetical protein IKR21_03590 [Oscillospiraceae bacterium]|nr:hypothetical protein [Oscillospiraceae bacterium]